MGQPPPSDINHTHTYTYCNPCTRRAPRLVWRRYQVTSLPSEHSSGTYITPLYPHPYDSLAHPPRPPPLPPSPIPPSYPIVSLLSPPPHLHRSPHQPRPLQHSLHLRHPPALCPCQSPSQPFGIYLSIYLCQCQYVLGQSASIGCGEDHRKGPGPI